MGSGSDRTRMRGLLFGTIVCCGLVSPVSAAPFLYYDFESPDSPDDNVVTDVSGNGRNGSVAKLGTGSAISYVTDKPSGVAGTHSVRLDSNGTTGAVRIHRAITTSDLNFSGQDWSFVSWFKTEDAVPADNEMILHIGPGDGFGGEDELYVNVTTGTGGNLRLQHFPNTDVDIARTVSDPNAWHHVAVTYEHSPKALRFYVDGALVGTDTAFSLAMNQSTATAFGGLGGGGFPDRNFDGWLDDVALYRDTLTATEVAGLAGGTLSPTDVPEPSAALLAVGTIAGAGLLRRRRAAN